MNAIIGKFIIATVAFNAFISTQVYALNMDYYQSEKHPFAGYTNETPLKRSKIKLNNSHFNFSATANLNETPVKITSGIIEEFKTEVDGNICDVQPNHSVCNKKNVKNFSANKTNLIAADEHTVFASEADARRNEKFPAMPLSPFNPAAPVGGNPPPPIMGNNSPTSPMQPATAGFDSVMMVMDKVVAFGQKILPTVREGTPVVQISNMSSIAVLPRVEVEASSGGVYYMVPEMGNWSLPTSKRFRVRLTDSLGRTAAAMEYAITFQHSGNIKGTGKYLNGVRVTPRSLRVNFGWDLTVESQLITVSNMGSEQNVIASAQIEITYTLKNIFGTTRFANSYLVTGDGRAYRVD